MSEEQGHQGLSKAMLLGALLVCLTLLFCIVMAFSVATILGIALGIVTGIAMFFGSSAVEPYAFGLWFGILLVIVLQGVLVLIAFLLIRTVSRLHQHQDRQDQG